MLVIGIIGIILAVAFLIYATMRDFEPAYSLIVVALIVAITNGLNFEEAWLTTLFNGTIDVFKSTTPVLICGMMFASIFAVSGASRKLANGLLEFFTKIIRPKEGKEVNVGVTVTICVSFAIAWIFQFFGVDGMVAIITLFPLVTQMLRKYNLPRKVMPTLLMAGSMMVPMPFSTNFQNATGSEMLGTTIGAGTIPGIVACLITMVGNFLLIRWFFLKESKKTGWNDLPTDPQIDTDKNMPHFILSIIPIVCVFILYAIFGLKLPTCFVICTIIEVLFYLPQLKLVAQKRETNIIEVFKEEVNKGVKNAMYLSLVVALLVGYSSIVTSTNAFNTLVGSITAGNGKGLLIIMVIVFLVMVFVACNPVSGFFSNVTLLAPKFIEAGIAPAVVHRLNMICVTVFDSLPTSTGIITSVKLCGCNMRDSYKYLFATTVIMPLFSTIVMTIMFMTGLFS